MFCLKAVATIKSTPANLLGLHPRDKMGETLFLHQQGGHMWGHTVVSRAGVLGGQLDSGRPSKIKKWTPLA